MQFNYCPVCGASLLIHEDKFAPQKCGACGRTQYHNSIPCAGALVIQDERVLLVQRAVEPAKGCWDIPGGFLHADEHPIDGMRREINEETGLDIRVLGLLGVYMDRYLFEGEESVTLNHYYIVEPIGGELKAADDVNDYRWFDLDHLPADSMIAFEHEVQVLRDLRLNRKTFRIGNAGE